MWPVSTEDNKRAFGDPSLSSVEGESPAAEVTPEAIEEVEIVIPEASAAAAEGESPEDDPIALKARAAAAEEKVKELSEKLKEYHERLLRTAADLDNFRKRSLKEKEEIRRYGIEKMLKDFLPIQDNLERALDHAKSGGDFDSLRQGIGMTRKLFEDSLARHGVRSFNSVGRPFDPRLHEALQQVDSTDFEPNHVVSEVVKGYLLHDRLARPALVVVSKSSADAVETNPSSEPAPVQAEQVSGVVRNAQPKGEPN